MNNNLSLNTSSPTFNTNQGAGIVRSSKKCLSSLGNNPKVARIALGTMALFAVVGGGYAAKTLWLDQSSSLIQPKFGPELPVCPKNFNQSNSSQFNSFSNHQGFGAGIDLFPNLVLPNTTLVDTATTPIAKLAIGLELCNSSDFSASLPGETRADSTLMHENKLIAAKLPSESEIRSETVRGVTLGSATFNAQTIYLVEVTEGFTRNTGNIIFDHYIQVPKAKPSWYGMLAGYDANNNKFYTYKTKTQKLNEVIESSNIEMETNCRLSSLGSLDMRNFGSSLIHLKLVKVLENGVFRDPHVGEKIDPSKLNQDRNFLGELAKRTIGFFG